MTLSWSLRSHSHTPTRALARFAPVLATALFVDPITRAAVQLCEVENYLRGENLACLLAARLHNSRKPLARPPNSPLE